LATLASIRSKLDTKIFNKIGSTATLTPFTSQTTDKWGDATVTTGTPVTITLVPYQYAKSMLSYEKIGALQAGEVYFIVPYSTSVGVNDKITFDSADYIILELESYSFTGGELAKQLRCKKILT